MTTTTTNKTTTSDARLREVLAAVEALLSAKDARMETPVEWRALRRAVRKARKTKNQ